MTEKTELIITTNNIPKSFNPINRIANGTHATLGKDCSPTANELIVFPKPENFTMANPITMPTMIDIENPIISRYIVTAIPSMRVLSCINPSNELETIAGEGNATLGHTFNKNTICHIPINTAIKRVTLATLSRSSFLDSFRREPLFPHPHSIYMSLYLVQFFDSEEILFYLSCSLMTFVSSSLNRMSAKLYI